MQEGCCLMGAHSPEVPTIFLQAVEISDKYPARVSKNQNLMRLVDCG